MNIARASEVTRMSIARKFIVAIFGMLTPFAIQSSVPAQLSTKAPVVGVLSPFIDVARF